MPPPFKCPTLAVPSAVQRVYSRKGWAGLTHLYSSEKLCKERMRAGLHTSCNNSRYTSRALMLLDGQRKRAIAELHTQAQSALVARGLTEAQSPSVSQYKEFGNTSITSDYDVTILGPLAPEVCAYMLLLYFLRCEISMETAFDTNLYTIGYFLKGPCRTELSTNILHVPSHNYMALQPTNVAQGKKMITYACMKLLSAENRPTCLIPIMTKRAKDMLDIAALWYHDCRTVYPAAIQPIVQKATTARQTRTTKTRTKKRGAPAKLSTAVVAMQRHCLQYYFATRLFDRVYAGNGAKYRAAFAAESRDQGFSTPFAIMKRVVAALDAVVTKRRQTGHEMDWIDLSALGSIYQIDAYYTLCSVNAVVLEIQRVGRGKMPDIRQRSRHFRNCDGVPVALAPVNYICAVIECGGDVLHNYERFRRSNVPVRIFAPKLEKYLRRIEYCLRVLTAHIPELAYKSKALRVYHNTLRRTHKVHSFMPVFKCILSALLDCVTLHIHRRELYR